ncbi:MAG: hypothetical protein V2A79_18245, partial [Planctomycetota bacterium]
PPESLAGPLADMEGEQPGDRVSGLDPGVPGASTMTDRAGPPETLAGPLPEDEGASVVGPPSSVAGDGGEPALRPAEKPVPRAGGKPLRVRSRSD